MLYTRRDLGKLALAALPATLLAKPNSKWGGVQVGLNVPYSFHNLPGTADDILKYCTDLDISALELRSQPVEAFLGAPHSSRIGGGRAGKTPEEQAAQKTAADELEKWRLAAHMDKFKEFRKKYEDAGIAHSDRQVRRRRQDEGRSGRLRVRTSPRLSARTRSPARFR